MSNPHPLQGACLEWYWHQGILLDNDWGSSAPQKVLIPEHLLAAVFVFNLFFHKSYPFFLIDTRLFKSMTLYDESNIKAKPHSFEIHLVDTPYFHQGTPEREARIKELADNQLVHLRYYRDRWMSRVIMSINNEDAFGPLNMDLVDNRVDFKLANSFAAHVSRFEKYNDYDIQPHHFTKEYFTQALAELKILDQYTDAHSRIGVIMTGIIHQYYVDRWFLELCRECFQGILDHLNSMKMNLKYISFQIRIRNHLKVVESKLAHS